MDAAHPRGGWLATKSTPPPPRSAPVLVDRFFFYQESSVFLVSIIFLIQTKKCTKLFTENIKQILHATVLDIKVCYYPRNAIFHEATGQVEYYHSEGINKPDISDVGPHPHAAGILYVIYIGLRVRVNIHSEDALSADGGSSTTQGNVL